LVFRAESDLCVGYHKLGFVQRTRYYIPARNFWAATTAGKTWRMNSGDYLGIGAALDKHVRFSYFFLYDPETSKILVPWDYTNGGIRGMKPEDFEATYVSSRARTAVEPISVAATPGALFEVEFITANTSCGKSVRWLGYVWIRQDTTYCVKEVADLLSRVGIGGERRYGMGKLALDGEPTVARKVFGLTMEVDGEGPVLDVPAQTPLMAHLSVKGCQAGMRGDLEPLTGRVWDPRRGAGQSCEEPCLCWTPGSLPDGDLRVRVGARGVWDTA
jgi:hypothetical protein